MEPRKTKPETGVKYVLRFNLSSANCQEQLAELGRYARDNSIDEILFFADQGEEFSPGLLTLAEAAERVRVLAAAFSTVRTLGIRCGLNMWWTVGFSNFSTPRDRRDKFCFQRMVDAGGAESLSWYCPLDARWRKHIEKYYACFAQLKPSTLFIDDDFRYFGRGELIEPCFCPLHLAAFGKRMKRSFSRKELVSLIRQPPPNPLRNAWLVFLAETLEKVAGRLAHAVWEVSPDTQMGLMTGNPEFHCVEGRRWKPLLAQLTKTRPPVVRPSMNCYNSQDDFKFWLGGLPLLLHTRALVPPQIRLWPEIENYPGTRFAKSAQAVRLQMALAALCGMGEITLDLYGFSGNSLGQDDRYAQMLRQNRPYFETLTRLGTVAAMRGIGLPFHEHGAEARHWRKDLYGGWVALRPWDVTLPLLGFATTYGNADVTAISGDTINAFSDEEIRALLSKGLMMGGGAAEALQTRGLGDFLGATIGKRRPCPSAEELVETGESMTLRGERMFFEIVPGARSRVVSRFLDTHRRFIAPGVTLFENSLGGRVAIFPHDGQAGGINNVFFRNYVRQRQLESVLTWLNRRTIPLQVEGAPDVLPLCFVQRKKLVVAVANFSSDPLTPVKLKIGGITTLPNEVTLLRGSGRFARSNPSSMKVSGDALRLTLETHVGHLDLLVVQLTF